MKKFFKFSAAFLLGLVPLAGSAWSSPDCGPGYFVSKNNNGIVTQTVGATTNATSLFSHTAAITSGTSGCSNDGIIHRTQEQNVFVAVNLENLLQAIAQSRGEHLESMARLMGCETGALPEFTRVARTEVRGLLASGAVGAPELLVAL